MNKSIFVSATPGKFELELSNPERTQDVPATRAREEDFVDFKATASAADSPPYSASVTSRPRKGKGRSGRLGWDEIGDLVDAQVVIRPTGITDPPVDIRPSEGQVADLVEECRARGQRGERVLVTALTKRMAGENLTRRDRKMLVLDYHAVGFRSEPASLALLSWSLPNRAGESGVNPGFVTSVGVGVAAQSILVDEH